MLGSPPPQQPTALKELWQDKEEPRGSWKGHRTNPRHPEGDNHQKVVTPGDKMHCPVGLTTLGLEGGGEADKGHSLLYYVVIKARNLPRFCSLGAAAFSCPNSLQVDQPFQPCLGTGSLEPV